MSKILFAPMRDTDGKADAREFQREAHARQHIVLGMVRETVQTPHGPVVAMRFGRQKINLRPITASKRAWFTADHESAGAEDLCFLTKATPQQVVDHLDACGVAIAEGPGNKRGAMGTIVSVYCRDPDGSLIEISSYI